MNRELFHSRGRSLPFAIGGGLLVGLYACAVASTRSALVAVAMLPILGLPGLLCLGWAWCVRRTATVVLNKDRGSLRFFRNRSKFDSPTFSKYLTRHSLNSELSLASVSGVFFDEQFEDDGRGGSLLVFQVKVASKGAEAIVVLSDVDKVIVRTAAEAIAEACNTKLFDPSMRWACGVPEIVRQRNK